MRYIDTSHFVAAKWLEEVSGAIPVSCVSIDSGWRCGRSTTASVDIWEYPISGIGYGGYVNPHAVFYSPLIGTLMPDGTNVGVVIEVVSVQVSRLANPLACWTYPPSGLGYVGFNVRGTFANHVGVSTNEGIDLSNAQSLRLRVSLCEAYDRTKLVSAKDLCVYMSSINGRSILGDGYTYPQDWGEAVQMHSAISETLLYPVNDMRYIADGYWQGDTGLMEGRGEGPANSISFQSAADVIECTLHAPSRIPSMWSPWKFAALENIQPMVPVKDVEFVH